MTFNPVCLFFSDASAPPADVEVPLPLTEPIQSSVVPTARIAPVTNTSASVSSWTVDDVCHWLSSMALNKHAQTFRDNDIDGYELLHLDKETMEKELRIGMCLIVSNCVYMCV